MTGNRSAWKIAMGQIPITMGDKRANIAEVIGAISTAGKKGCDLIVLPECCLAGWLSPAASESAEAIPGPLTRRLSALARKHRIAIVMGIEERGDEGQIFNTALLFDTHGTLRLRHRKVNELNLARATYSPGASLNVIELSGRAVALSICADSWRPEITDALHLMGARVILSPCAWAVEPGGEATNLSWITETYRQRVGSRALFMVAANAVGAVTQGPWRGRILQGNSLVIGPGGEVVLCGPTNEPALIYFELPESKCSLASQSL